MTEWKDVRCDGQIVNRVCLKCGQTFGNSIEREHRRPPTREEIVERHTWERKPQKASRS